MNSWAWPLAAALSLTSMLGCGGTRGARSSGAVASHDAGGRERARVQAKRDAAVDAADSARRDPDAAPVSGGRGAALPPPEPLPNCATPAVDFDAPPLPSGGEIAIGLSAWLVPAGVNERAFVDVLADGDPDSDFAGSIVWDLPEGVSMVAATLAHAGRAEVTFRFAHAGTFRLEAHLDGDPRTGFAEVQVYAPQLPIWEVQVERDAFERILSNPESNQEIPGMLRIDGDEHPMTMRLHSDSSRRFPKKSFRFELKDTDEVNGTYGTTLIARAEYNDKTLLRNWLALRMFAQGTRIPTARSKLVHLRVNDRYYGVMHNVERIDSHLLDRFGLASSGSMYEADPIDALSSPGANLTALPAEHYPDVYPLQNGTLDYADLREFIEHTLLLPDAEFDSAIERELEVDDYLDYLAMLAMIQNQDHVSKNYSLYRDPAGSAGWRLIPWDLDLSFGHLWSEANETLEEAIVADSDIFVGVKVPERGGFYNQLIDRMLTRAPYRARFRNHIEQLFADTVNSENADLMLRSAIRCAGADIFADRQKRASNGEYLARVAEINAFLDARIVYIHALP